MARVSAKKADEDRTLLTQLKGWRDQELSRQSANRYQMALDEDYYDSIQYTPDEAAELLKRGQPPVVYNEVKPTVDWLVGTERRTRTDFKVAPTQKSDEALEDAQNKTKVLKYLSEVNRTPFTRSQSFKDSIRAGVGWIEVGVRADPEDEPIYDRHESWRNMLYDSLGSSLDLNQDSRYLFRMKWLDLDIAQAYFPDKAAEVEQSAEGNPGNRGFDWWYGRRLSEIDPADGDFTLQSRWMYYDASAWLHNPRDRVQVFEAWYLRPTIESTRIGSASHDVTRMRMHCAIFTDTHMLWSGVSPYRHNRFPFIPVWCYRRARDNAPYGVIRSLRGPQDSLNKRMSKSVFVMSTNQVVMEKAAIEPSVMDEQEIREEASAPDGMIILASGGMEKFEIRRENDVAQAHMQLAERDRASIRQIGGVTSESLGRDTNLVSGVALQAKHDQGSLLTAEPLDNLRLARQQEGELKIALIEQYMTEPKVIRLTGERGKHDFLEINAIDETTGQRVNDVTAFKAQFIIDEQDFREDLRRAMFEQLMEMLGRIAQVDPLFARNTLDLVMEYGDMPGRAAFVKRVRDITGQPDPDAPPDPAAEQERLAQKQKAAQMDDLALEKLAAEVAELKARAGKGENEKILKMVEAMFNAMQAANIVATNPAVTPVADALLAGAGYQDAGGQDPNIPAPAPPALPANALPVPADPVGASGALFGGELSAA